MVKILLINGVNIDGATGAAARLPPVNNSAQGRHGPTHPPNNSKLGYTINTCWCTQIKNLGAHAPRIRGSATKYLIWAHRCD